MTITAEVLGQDGEVLTRAKGPRPDWKMATTTPTCDYCAENEDHPEGVATIEKVAGCHCEDGWELFWWCPRCEDQDYDGLEMDWPFLQTEYATVKDLEALGFTEVA